MIVRKFYLIRPDGVNLYISYSDANLKIRQDQTGAVYDAAIDVETAPYTYTETSEPVGEPIDPEYHELDIPAQDALDAIFGGAK